METKEIKAVLEGQEINAISLATTVMIKNGKVISEGKEIKITDQKWKELWNDYLEQNGISPMFIEVA